MRKILMGFILLAFVLVLLIQISGNQHIYRTIAMTILRGQMGPDIDELNDFPTRSIEKIHPEPWAKSSRYGLVKPEPSMMKEMHQLQTTAILVIENDSILYEDYFEGYDANTLSNSFSMAKSFTGLLIGCALKDGLIQSLDEPVGNYIEDFASEPYNKISIRHLLMMSSGLDFNETYGSLFAWPAKAYYGKDVNATILHAPKLDEPGTVFAYKGGDSQLLGMILKKATGQSVSDYAEKRLWQKIGAENTAYWSLDQEKGMEKVSCCYYATAHDFARFGKLAMQYGRWGNEQLIDSSFVAQCRTPAPVKTQSGKPNKQYAYQWWIMEHASHPVFYARGILGQYILCIPDKNMIIVRLGHKRAEKNEDDMPKDVYDYLNMGLAMSRP